MSAEEGPLRPELAGDEADLFREFNSRLVNILRGKTSASRETIDDACAFAWQQFLVEQPDRERAWRGWLVTTAERELWRLCRVEREHAFASLDDAEERDAALRELPDDHDRAAIRARLREALTAFAALPERRREIKALQIEGYSYEEIAEMRGLTRTRVNHLLVEAHAKLREDQGRSVSSAVGTPPRAVRLEELEQDPPTWLRRAIGRVPSVGDDARAVLAWRRAALAINDYRERFGRGLRADPLGERPREREAARAFDLARSAIERAREAKSRPRQRGIER